MRQVWAERCATAAVLALAGVLGGCSSSDLSTSALSKPAANFSSFFASAATTATGTTPSGGTPEFECPGVTIRNGASTMAISANASEDSAMNLKYQAGLGQTARECKLNGQTLTMRVGLHGRVILGPAGGPGTIELPVRLAVVHEGPEPKTITTKLNRIPVTVPAGDANVQFTTIEEDLTFQMPRQAGLIDEYVVYVGFDPQGLREPPKRSQPRGGPPKPSR